MPTIGQVDDAVRAVLAGLRRAPRPDRRSSGVFAGRLLGERQVERLGPEIREVRIAPTTVITPIARDHLKRRGILIRWVSEHLAGRLGEWGFVIEEGVAMADPIRRSLLGSEGSWHEAGQGVIEAAQWVASEEGRGAVVFTDQGSVACWLAAQVAGVRSAAPGDADGVARAVEHLGVNLLVLEPAGHSLPSLLHCVKVFRKSGAPECPDWLDGRTDDANRRGDRPRDLLSTAPERAESALSGGRPDASGGDHRRLVPARGGTGRVR
ncbi:hypothetical protein [Tautonia marina]|uniref:hypothetical protein n=1 Tax=Tautonia marina TaxID=2653855 RepID=UPI001F3A8EA3|nr:hypothetical protein [Tautonia marina]